MLEGIKVIELSNVLAGPAVGMFFSELGAQVVKIENKSTGGDMTRHWKTGEEDEKAPVSAYYASVNWKKETYLLDLTHPADREMVYSMAGEADIVITNYKPGSAEKLGMDYGTFKKLNSKIIYGHISGFGEAEGRTAYDVIVQAETGFMSMNGTAESGPLKMPVALIDLMAAHQLKEGLLLALLKRNTTGRGSHVSVSLYDAAVASLANQASNYLMTGKIPQRAGSLHPNIAPYGEVFNTADEKPVVLAIGTDKQFNEMCRVLGAERIAGDKAYKTNPVRVKNRQQLYEELAPFFRKFQREPLMEAFITKDVPAGAVKDLDEVFKNPLTFSSVLEEETEGTNTKRVKTVAFKIDGNNT